MMIDQYKEQYNRETEQIHAPAELIARTKADPPDVCIADGRGGDKRDSGGFRDAVSFCR